MPEKYKLIYFALRARGEFIRYILAHANVPYEDVIIQREDWPTYREKTPFNILPILELENGTQLSQSLAIGRYLASKHGLTSKDDLENAFGDQVLGAIEDIYLPYFRPVGMAFFAKDDAKVKEAIKNLMDNGLGPLFTRLEKLLGDKKWFCGQNVHWTDLYVAELFDRIEKSPLVKPDWISKYPKLEAHCRRVHEIPNIKKYVEKRTQYPL